MCINEFLLSAIIIIIILIVVVVVILILVVVVVVVVVIIIIIIIFFIIFIRTLWLCSTDEYAFVFIVSESPSLTLEHWVYIFLLIDFRCESYVGRHGGPQDLLLASNCMHVSNNSRPKQNILIFKHIRVLKINTKQQNVYKYYKSATRIEWGV